MDISPPKWIDLQDGDHREVILMTLGTGLFAAWLVYDNATATAGDFSDALLAASIFIMLMLSARAHRKIPISKHYELLSFTGKTSLVVLIVVTVVLGILQAMIEGTIMTNPIGKLAIMSWAFSIFSTLAVFIAYIPRWTNELRKGPRGPEEIYEEAVESSEEE